MQLAARPKCAIEGYRTPNPRFPTESSLFYLIVVQNPRHTFMMRRQPIVPNSEDNPRRKGNLCLTIRDILLKPAFFTGCSYSKGDTTLLRGEKRS